VIRRWVLAGVAVSVAALCGVALAAILRPGTPPRQAGSRPPAAGTPSPGPASLPPSPSQSASPSPSADPGCGPWGCAQQRRFAAAAALAKAKPGYLGIVVRDRQSGALWRAGTAGHVMWASSTVKLAMATSILDRARAGQITLDAEARAQLAAMFSVSDNDAADALWKRYGRDTMIGRFQQVYGMTGLRFVPGSPRYWGFLKCSAEDLQRLMSYVLGRLDPRDRDYIAGAMRHVGAIQRWGVWAAGPALQPGTKDGWSIESDPGGRHWCTSTVGFAGPGERYVVAVMYRLPPGSGTIGAGVHAVSDLVATVFGSPVPAKVTVPDPSTGL
jgi:hypothetical protein